MHKSPILGDRGNPVGLHAKRFANVKFVGYISGIAGNHPALPRKYARAEKGSFEGLILAFRVFYY